MIRVILVGAAGRMGQNVSRYISGQTDVTIVARVDSCYQRDKAEHLYEDIAACQEEADGIIVFAHHLGTKKVLDFAVSHHLPAVIGTTGHTQEELEHIDACARKIPLFISGNMSFGVEVLTRAVVSVVSAYQNDCDIEIVETHHAAKKDAPSGTAIQVAQRIVEKYPERSIVSGRSGDCLKKPGEIGISSVRIGQVVGTHEVLIHHGSETITLTHDVQDRQVFAEGAVNALRYLMGKPDGKYTMRDYYENTLY